MVPAGDLNILNLRQCGPYPYPVVQARLVFGILNDERAMQRFAEGKEVNRFRPTIRSPLIDRDVSETSLKYRPNTAVVRR
jgi:hypothetical protein